MVGQWLVLSCSAEQSLEEEKQENFPFFLFYLKSFHIVILDWSYNYHANMYQQVAPIAIYVKKLTYLQSKQKKTWYLTIQAEGVV